MTTITTLPTPPTRDDPINFADRADTFLAALPTFATETNTVASEINTKHNEVMSAEIIENTVRGQWTPSTVYVIKDIYTDNGIAYLVVVGHTSTSIANDSANGKVKIYQGVAFNDLSVPAGAELVGYKTETVADYLTGLSNDTSGILSNIAYIDQYITGFFGRGMLTAETVDASTNQVFTASAIAGDTSVPIASTTNFEVGGTCVIKYPQTTDYPFGMYKTHFITSKTINSLGILPGLIKNVSTTDTLERTWFNRAHPGKYYMRYLAQRLAHSTEVDAAIPLKERLAFIDFSDSSVENTLIGVGSGLVFYYDVANIGEAGVQSPTRFAFSKNAYIENILAIGDGVRTAEFDVGGFSRVVLKMPMYVSSSTTSYKIQVLDQNGIERGVYNVAQGTGVQTVHTVYADVAGVSSVYVKITCLAAPSGYFTIGRLDIFDAPMLSGKIIAKQTAVIVLDGDSWSAGDALSTTEREPISTQLGIELPLARIENKAVGGSTLIDVFNRFDTTAAAVISEHGRIDYWIISTGTNESYNPFSGTFDPDALDAFVLLYKKLLNKIASVGARPIILGVPALAQSDSAVPSFPEWQLLSRARLYEQKFIKSMSNVPMAFKDTTGVSNVNGIAVKFSDGTMICRHTVTVTTTAPMTLASSLWTFPVGFVSAPKVTVTLTNYSSDQLITTGLTSAAISTTATIGLVSGTSAYTGTVDCLAVGKWLA